jgi:hypothetical protein
METEGFRLKGFRKVGGNGVELRKPSALLAADGTEYQVVASMLVGDLGGAESLSNWGAWGECVSVT